ncbi:ubiquitin carboxyl-terminal hydrolase-domain-containing protein [Boletus reticuloceps]|uniref:Ubiquitin carboxyl-terminal hydrolase-domain-containing protein n=1 Tax=Boletus reticuloceps TaxID=495285 RepID=A0A8I2YVJ2_9AGAM|nr:ubiquitin carboxyl-terminal hydrolase-domain-containing protein [Boletus reticuloceps]
MYRPTIPIASHGQLPVTALAFDPVSDSIWAGDNAGAVCALHSIHGLRGVSFPVGGALPVKQLAVADNHVRALGLAGHGVGAWAKGGMNKWYYRVEPSTVSAMSPTIFSSNIVAAATTTPEIVLLNAITGSVLRQAPTPSHVTHLAFSHSTLLSASADGYVRTHDPRTAIHSENGDSAVLAHASGVQDLQATGNLFFTIGSSSRSFLSPSPPLSLTFPRRGHDFPDPLVKVYDLRYMRPLSPIPFSDGPAFINLLPKLTSSLVVTSAQGLVNVVDASNTNTSGFYHLETTSYITSTAVSSNGSYLAFGDAVGTIHLLTAADESSEPFFNGFQGQPVEWADVPEHLPDITGRIPPNLPAPSPLNSIGMPYYTSTLLSSWTPQFLPSTNPHPPPAKIPPQILSTIKINDNVAYAALPKELRGRRNRVVVSTTKDQGRFRSGKGKRDDDVELEHLTLGDTIDEVPRMYRKVEIEYSKFGVEDFDFGYLLCRSLSLGLTPCFRFYNKTAYSGLETHILNSYTNPILQVMHYTLPIRKLARSHITTNCPREHCLLCELGFVVRMLEDAHGTNCQSSNFCKTVGILAQAQNQLELIDYGREPTEVDYAHMIQSFHRFLIDHLSSEGNSFPHNPVIFRHPPSHMASTAFQADTHPITNTSFSPAAAPVTQLLGIDAKNIIVCLSCKAVREKENMTHVVDMIYPRKPLPNELPPQAAFADILRASLIRQMTHKATCQTCKQFSTFSSRRSIPSADLPPILAVNASVYNDDNLKYWMDTRTGRFLSPTVEVRGEVEGVDDAESVTYELRVVPEAESQPHLKGPWFLFNDFVVRNISEDEALSFPKVKVPAVLYLEQEGVRSQFDFSSLSDELDPLILTRDTSISVNRDKNLVKHKCLRFEELPKPGTLVAIDAEFVSMQQEETEFRSDGTTRVIRPARLSLARVSVLRGDGPKEGIPFIDDHIHTSDVIVDYLTEFSGIKFGDLDPHLSRHTLTPLKLVYKKLRLLVDRGCIFIGHGLSKDFRIINIFVPPDQVIDTVDLYFLRNRQRRLSLRFLSWMRAPALRLYKAYHEFEERGVFDDKLEELYRAGKQHNWKPPSTAPTATSPTTTTCTGQVIAQSSTLLSPSTPSSQTPTKGMSGQGHGPTQVQTPNVSQFNMLAAAAAARNYGHQGQFQPMRFDMGALNTAATGYFASDMGSFGASGSGQGAGAGAGHGTGSGWNRR